MAGIEDLSPADAQAHALGKLLLSNPEVANQAKRLAKKANPALQLPEIDLEDALVRERNDSIAREKKIEDQLMAERVERRRAERNTDIVKAGFTVEEIEKIIVDEKCSYDTAMKLAAALRQTAEPSAPDIRSSTMIGEPLNLRPADDWKKLDKAGAQRLGLKLAHEMVDDFRKQRRAGAR